MHQNPICETKVPDPHRNKCVCVCVRTLRLRARVKPMWQHKDRLISSSLSVPFLPLCCLTTYSLSSNVRALCSPAQSSASSDSADLWPPHPDIPATQAHTAHSIWHFSCMEKKKTLNTTLSVCVRETQAGFFCASNEPSDNIFQCVDVQQSTYESSLVLHHSIHETAPALWKTERVYFQATGRDTSPLYSESVVLSSHCSILSAWASVSPLSTPLLFTVKIWIADFPQNVLQSFGQPQWNILTVASRHFSSPRVCETQKSFTYKKLFFVNTAVVM